MRKNSLRLLGFLLAAMMMVSLFAVGVFAGDTANVAKIGDTEYATLQAAITAAKAGDTTITLLRDCGGSVSIKQESGKNITVEGDGNTFSGTIAINGSSRADGAETLTFKNVEFNANVAKSITGSSYAHNVKFVGCKFVTNTGYQIEPGTNYNWSFVDCSVSGNGAFWQAKSATNNLYVENFVAENGGNVFKIDYCATKTVTATFKNVEIKSGVVGFYISDRNSGTVYIEDCTVNCQYPVYIWHRIDAPGVVPLVFTGENLLHSTANQPQITGAVGTSYTIEGEETIKDVNMVAQIGDVKYATLAEAIAAANAADGATTVTLLADVTLSEKLTITGDVTIEGAYTITRGDAYTGTLFTVNAGATLTLDGGLTIDGGNNWAYTVFPPVMDLENGSGTKVADHITPAEGGVNATAHMIVNNGTLNVHSVTIENSYSIGEVSLINAGANSVTILDGATIRHTAANRSGAVANIGGIDAILTIKGTTRITDNFGVGNGGIIQNYGQGTTVNLEGGSIDNNFVGKSGALYASYSSKADKINTFNMTGGIITENVMEGYGPVYIHTNTVWNMSGGEISKNVSYLPSYVRNNNPAGSMTGGKIANNEITGLDYSGGYYLTRPDLRLNGKTAITGGIYSQNVFEYIAPNTGVAYDDGLYTVVSEGLYKLHLTDPVTGEPATIPYIEGNVLASLVATGKLFYADYYEMTLEVLYDVKIDETVVIDYPMTIDLNGHTITGYSTMQTTPVFRVVSDVTVIGEGKVDGRPGSACYAFIVGQGENAGNLTIENGTFYGDISAISVTKGTATINGGKFAVTPYQVEGKEDNYNFLLNCIDKNYKDDTAKIVVKGGTFYKFNPAANAAEGAGTDFVPETHFSVDNGDGTFTVWKAVAKVGDTYFATLQDAFAACTNGETITLLVDLVYDADDVVPAHGGATGFGKYDQYNPSIIYIGGTKGATEAENQPSNVNAVLDLNGHTITNNADAYLFLFMDNCKVTIKDSKDGDGIINYANLPIIWACGTDTLVTIENGKYYNGNEAYGSLIHSTHAADIVIKGGEFKTALAEAPDLLKINTQKFNNPNYFLVGKATMTVTGGTFYGFNPEYTGDTYTKTDVDTVPETHAVYDNGDGSYTVMTYIEWIKAQLLAGNDVTLDRDIIVDGSMIESIPAPTNGNGRYPNYGIFNVVGDYDVTFDLNGHSITYNGHESFEWNGKTYNSCTVAHGLFFANDGAHLTIVGEGDIIVNGVASGVYSASPDTAITIQGGNWVNNGCAECGATNLFLYASHGGELYIEGGRFEQALDSEGNSYLIVVHGGEYKNSVIDYAKTKIVVTGGTFVGMDPSKAHYFRQTADNKLVMGETVDTVPMGYRASIYGTIDGVDVYNVVELKATVEAGSITYYFPGVENIDSVQELANYYFLMQNAMGWILGYDYEPVLTLFAELTDEVVLGNTPSDDTTVTLPKTVTWTIVTNGFNADLIKAAEGYVKIDNGDGTITIQKAVAKVGDTYFATLQDAFAACTNGETITLLVDLVYDADDVVPAHGGATGFGKYDQYNPSIIYIGGTKGATEAENQPSNVNAVLDLNGHTITNNADAYLFLFMDNCKVTIKDSKDGDGIIGNTEAPVIWVTGTDTLVTIENGKYTTANAEGLLWSTHGGDLVIKGGEFSTSAGDASLLIVRNAKDRRNPNYFIDGKATVTIYGGTFYGFNPEKTMDDSTDPFTEFNAVAEGYMAQDNGDNSWTVVLGKVYNTTTGNTFATIADAVADAVNTPGADYLILLQDHEEFLVTILEGMTLDLQDKTLTATYVFAAKGGYLVGNSSTKTNVNNGATAQLVVPKNNVALSSEAYYSGTSHRVLVWDKTQNAYVFSAVTISTKSSDGLGGFHLMTDELGQYMNVKFKLNASNYVYQNILTGSQADHGIKVVVTASWNTDTGVITQNLVFSDEDVLKTIQNSGWMNTAKVYLQGHDGLVMTVQIVTNTGNVIDSVSMTAAELLEQNNQ